MEHLHHRLATRTIVNMRVDWCVDGTTVRRVSDVVNLSSGGAFVGTGFSPPVGAAIEMQLLTSGGTVPVRARVVRKSRRGMAVRYEFQPAS